MVHFFLHLAFDNFAIRIGRLLDGLLGFILGLLFLFNHLVVPLIVELDFSQVLAGCDEAEQILIYNQVVGSFPADGTLPPLGRRAKVHVGYEEAPEIEGLVMACTVLGSNRDGYFASVELALKLDLQLFDGTVLHASVQILPQDLL
jgi:hypothetical protein